MFDVRQRLDLASAGARTRHSLPLLEQVLALPRNEEAT